MTPILLPTSLLRGAAAAILLTLLSSLPVQAVPSAAREWNEQILNAIRINLPNPPAHARNLHHLATAMYDSWTAYDTTAVGYIYNEKISPLPGNIEAARHEAISYAAYRLLRARFVLPPNPALPVSTTNPLPAGSATTSTRIDNLLTTLGYSTAIAQAALTNNPTPAELGKRIGQAILTWGATDGFSQTAYPQAYNAAVNPNMLTQLVEDQSNPGTFITVFPRAISVLGANGEPLDTIPLGRKTNMPLGVGFPLIANTEQGYTHDGDPNFWQPLALSTSVTQNGIPQPGGAQAYTGVQGLAITPFALTRTDPTKPWIDGGGPSRLSFPGNPSPTDALYKEAAMDVLRKSAHLNDQTLQDFGPGAFGNNTLDSVDPDGGTGYTVNPHTGLPYAPNMAKIGDFRRVMAEFWADGPTSETPPGHWHVVANEVSDDPLLVKKIGGVGPTVNALEWDIKTYFSVAAAVHDASCACWSNKRYYHGPRPITMIRYMGTKGQSSNPGGPSYHPQGLPLEPGVVEVITAASSAIGERHENIWNLYLNDYDSGGDHVGEIAIFSFPGEGRNNPPQQIPPIPALTENTVRWMLAKDWLPYQRKTFNTPPFPGYPSGHSTFSRAAAEVLTRLTGSPYFPGGIHHFIVPAHTMGIDYAPSANVDLQLATYYDGADQAGQSRRWGGIHPSEDDFSARIIGAQVGPLVYTLSEKYWNGSIVNESMIPEITILPGGNVKVTWKAFRGMNHKVMRSPDLLTWSDVTTSTISYTNGAVVGDTSGTWTDTSPPPGKAFYKIVRSPAP